MRIDPAEINPFLPPTARLGAQAPGDLIADAEVVRRAHLGREAAVKLLGLLGYLGAALGFGLAAFLSRSALEYAWPFDAGSGVVQADRGEIAGGVVLAWVGSMALAAIASGLRGLHACARWVTLTLVSLLLGLFGLALASAVVADPPLAFLIVLVYGGPALFLTWPFYLMLGPRAAVVFSARYLAVVRQTPQIRSPLGRIVGSALALLAGVLLCLGVMVALMWLNR